MVDEPKQLPEEHVLHSIYPDACGLFFCQKPLVEVVKAESQIFFDTNVLLVPYTIGKTSLGEIEKTFGELLKKGRLSIPGQVAREFAKHRATKIAAMVDKLYGERETVEKVKKGGGEYPLLQNLPSYQNAMKIRDDVLKVVGAYDAALGDVLKDVRSWVWDDPVSQLYAKLFGSDVVADYPLDEGTKKKVDEDWERRNANGIPPGYKDKRPGDLVIWYTILGFAKEKKKDVIFVTHDEKADWRLATKAGPLGPRFELIDEFRRESGGHAFHIIRFSEFLELFNAEKSAVEEVKNAESTVGTPVSAARSALASWAKRTMSEAAFSGDAVRRRLASSSIRDSMSVDFANRAIELAELFDKKGELILNENVSLHELIELNSHIAELERVLRSLNPALAAEIL